MRTAHLTVFAFCRSEVSLRPLRPSQPSETHASSCFPSFSDWAVAIELQCLWAPGTPWDVWSHGVCALCYSSQRFLLFPNNGLQSTCAPSDREERRKHRRPAWLEPHGGEVGGGGETRGRAAWPDSGAGRTGGCGRLLLGEALSTVQHRGSRWLTILGLPISLFPSSSLLRQDSKPSSSWLRAGPCWVAT